VPTSLFRPGLRSGGGKPVRLLFVGRLGDTRKGLRYLLEAYASLKQQGVPVVLDVVGELGEGQSPPSGPELTYHGSLDLARLIERYQACDVLVAPSTGQESFGIILLEAMASAKPIICSEIDGYRQVVLREGTRLVPPGDSQALARAIESFAALPDEERRHMGVANLAHVQSYDWDRIARRVRGEYLAAMGLSVEALDAPAPQAAPDLEEEAQPAAAQGTR
jgi:phosphatidylinositol alpha-mannosyltransferase